MEKIRSCGFEQLLTSRERANHIKGLMLRELAKRIDDDNGVIRHHIQTEPSSKPPRPVVVNNVVSGSLDAKQQHTDTARRAPEVEVRPYNDYRDGRARYARPGARVGVNRRPPFAGHRPQLRRRPVLAWRPVHQQQQHHHNHDVRAMNAPAAAVHYQQQQWRPFQSRLMTYPGSGFVPSNNVVYPWQRRQSHESNYRPSHRQPVATLNFRDRVEQRPRDGNYVDGQRPRDGDLQRPHDGDYGDLQRPRDGDYGDVQRPRDGDYGDGQRPREGGYGDGQRPRNGDYGDLQHGVNAQRTSGGGDTVYKPPSLSDKHLLTFEDAPPPRADYRDVAAAPVPDDTTLREPSDDFRAFNRYGKQLGARYDEHDKPPPERRRHVVDDLNMGEWCARTQN